MPRAPSGIAPYLYMYRMYRSPGMLSDSTIASTSTVIPKTAKKVRQRATDVLRWSSGCLISIFKSPLADRAQSEKNLVFCTSFTWAQETEYDSTMVRSSVASSPVLRPLAWYASSRMASPASEVRLKLSMNRHACESARGSSTYNITRMPYNATRGKAARLQRTRVRVIMNRVYPLFAIGSIASSPYFSSFSEKNLPAKHIQAHKTPSERENRANYGLWSPTSSVCALWGRWVCRNIRKRRKQE
eukprot:3326125-Rhodomonas_salina.2